MKVRKMMQYGILGALFLGGCAQRELVFTQNAICQAPIAKVYFQSVNKKEGHATIPQEEFKQILSSVIEKTGCIDLVSTMNEDSYVLNAIYEVDMSNQEKKETFKTQTQNILKAKVTLNLSHKNILRRDFGESSISTEENKILGIGESEKLSRDDEIKALKNSALVALKTFIASLQQTTQDRTSQD